MSEEAIAQARTEPWWPALEAVAHTTPYDAAITVPYMTGRPLPAQRWSKVTMPTLVLDGEVSPLFMREGTKALAGILPNATSTTFPGPGARRSPGAGRADPDRVLPRRLSRPTTPARTAPIGMPAS
jgi:hypothetical protein